MRCKEKKSVRQDSNLRPSAWKADALPTELHPLMMLSKKVSVKLYLKSLPKSAVLKLLIIPLVSNW